MKWISIKDRLPEEGQWVVVWAEKKDGSFKFAMAQHSEGKFYMRGLKLNPSHWMIPEPPIEEERSWGGYVPMMGDCCDTLNLHKQMEDIKNMFG